MGESGRKTQTGKDETESAPLERVRGSGVRVVYETIKREILEMTLAPGVRLDETRLSVRFSLSRTPIREALVRLTADGLVTTLPNSNTMVSVIDFASVPGYLDALTLMYRATCRLAAQRRNASDIDKMRLIQAQFAKAVVDTDPIAMITVNRDFHVAIARAGKNPYFTDFTTRLLDEGQRLLRVYYSSYDDHLPPRYVDEHDAIIRAVEKRDAATADELGAAHAAQVAGQIQSFLVSGVGRDMILAASA